MQELQGNFRLNKFLNNSINNCIDFAQQVQEIAGQREHFVEKIKAPSYGPGWLYAKLTSRFF